jgi:hypothetical protein
MQPPRQGGAALAFTPHSAMGGVKGAAGQRSGDKWGSWRTEGSQTSSRLGQGQGQSTRDQHSEDGWSLAMPLPPGQALPSGPDPTET